MPIDRALHRVHRCKARHGQHKTHFDHLFIRHSNHQLRIQYVLLCVARQNLNVDVKPSCEKSL